MGNESAGVGVGWRIDGRGVLRCPSWDSGRPRHPRVFLSGGGGGGWVALVLLAAHLTCAHPCPCRQPDTEGHLGAGGWRSSTAWAWCSSRATGGSFAHAIWHLFVAFGAGTHYYAIWRYLYLPFPAGQGVQVKRPSLRGDMWPLEPGITGVFLQPWPRAQCPGPSAPMGQAFSGSKITSGDKPDHPLGSR